MSEDVSLRWKWRLLPVELGVETRDVSICVTAAIDVWNSQVKITTLEARQKIGTQARENCLLNRDIPDRRAIVYNLVQRQKP